MPRILLLGPIQFKSDDGAVLAPDLRRKTRAFLAYACLTDEALSRDHLANLFCRSSNDPYGALRWHMSRIRRNFHDVFLHTHDDEIRIDHSKLWIDALQFMNAVDNSSAVLDPTKLEAALKLYRGELLSGMHLPDDIDYELWLLGHRARYSQAFEKGTLKLIQHLVAAADYESALHWAKRLLNHNSSLEDAHYWWMWLHAKSGQKQVALQQFETYQEHMQREFSAKAGDHLTDLQCRIMENRPLPDLIPQHQRPVYSLPDSAMPFVGRFSELDVLHRRWNSSVNKQGHAVILKGDAGIGKSALIDRFVSQLSGDANIYKGVCYESTQTAALNPWIQIIRESLSRIMSDVTIALPDVIRFRLSLLVPDLIPLSPAELAAHDQGNLNSLLLLTTVIDFLSLVAANKPTMIILEDVHFADENSILLLSLLFQRLSRVPIMVIVTQRTIESQENPPLQRAIDEWQTLTAVDWLTLYQLEPQCISELIDKILPDIDNKDEFLHELIDHTMGISLHIVDVLQTCQAQPGLLEKLPIPQRFDVLVKQRMQKMTNNQRQLLETLAIMDCPANLSQILECTGQNETEMIHNLEHVTSQRFIASQSEDSLVTYTLRHFLYRDVIISSMSAARRQVLHRRVARLFERHAALLPGNRRGDVVTRVVYHARHAGDVDTLARWVPIAARLASEAFAYPEALELFRILDTALRQTPILPVEEHIGILLKQVELLRFLGDWKAQGEVLQRIAEWDKEKRIAQQDVRLQYLIEHGTNLFRSGDYAHAGRLLMEAIAHEREAGDQLTIAQAYNTLGNIAHYQSDWDAAEKHYKRAIALRHAHGDEVGVGKGYNNLGAVAHLRGNYREAEKYYRQNLKIREAHQDRHGIATCLNNLGAVYMSLGQWDIAADQFERALQVRRQLDDKHGIASTLQNLGQIRMLQDQLPEAIPLYRESLSLREAIHDVDGVARSLSALGELYCITQEWHLAIEHLQRSLDIRRQLGNKLDTAQSMLNLCYAQAMQVGTYPDDSYFEAMQVGYDLDSVQIMCTAIEQLVRINIRLNDGIQASRCAGLVSAHKRDQRRDIMKDALPALYNLLEETTLSAEIERGAGMALRQVILTMIIDRSYHVPGD